MLFSSIKIENFKSIESIDLSLSNVNVLIGQNNSGKSSFIDAISSFQEGSRINKKSVRIGSKKITVTARPCFKPSFIHELNGQLSEDVVFTLKLEYNTSEKLNITAVSVMRPVGLQPVRAIRSKGFIIKYLSARKVQDYNEVVSRKNFDSISNDFSNLTSVLSEITNPFHPCYEYYCNKSEEILGFVVTEVLTDSGQEPGLRLSSGQNISIKEMGSGVCNIVSLIAELSLAENKLFLIEEMENDIHPRALKAILEIINEKSNSNQFVISTHSSIVLTHLFTHIKAKIFHFRKDYSLGTNTIVDDITDNKHKRREVLEDLGYSFMDYGLHNGWIILEEASMEAIVRDYLMRWFCPSLYGRVRCVSANGADNTLKHFGELKRMYLYVHLEPIYANRAWVILDGDVKGREVKSKLISAYGVDFDKYFICLEKTGLEEYYPAEVEFDAEILKNLVDNNEKRAYKMKCLQKFKSLSIKDDNLLRDLCAESFKEVILILKDIESQIPDA